MDVSPEARHDESFIFSRHPLALEPWRPNWVTKRFITWRRQAGVGHFRLHDLRHFMATQMLGAGVAVPIVSARLAHARASTTLNVYAHAIPGGDAQAAQLISGIVNPSDGGSQETVSDVTRRGVSTTAWRYGMPRWMKVSSGEQQRNPNPGDRGSSAGLIASRR